MHAFSLLFSAAHVMDYFVSRKMCNQQSSEITKFSLSSLEWFAYSLQKFIIFPFTNGRFSLKSLICHWEFPPAVNIFFPDKFFPFWSLYGILFGEYGSCHTLVFLELRNIRVSHSIMTWSKGALFSRSFFSDYAIFPALLRGNIIQSLKSPVHLNPSLSLSLFFYSCRCFSSFILLP